MHFCAGARFYRTGRARPLLLAGVETLMPEPHRSPVVVGFLLRGVYALNYKKVLAIYIPPGTMRETLWAVIGRFSREVLLFFARTRRKSALKLLRMRKFA